VEYLLKNYNGLNQEIKDFKVLLEERVYCTEEEVIEGLAFKRSIGEKVQNNNISDRTPTIAMIYKEVMNQENTSGVSELQKIITASERELRKLESALSRLSTEENKILKSLYFEKRTYREVSLSLSISESTLSRRRRKAIGYIAGVFSIMYIA